MLGRRHSAPLVVLNVSARSKKTGIFEKNLSSNTLRGVLIRGGLGRVNLNRSSKWRKNKVSLGQINAVFPRFQNNRWVMLGRNASIHRPMYPSTNNVIWLTRPFTEDFNPPTGLNNEICLIGKMLNVLHKNKPLLIVIISIVSKMLTISKRFFHKNTNFEGKQS